MPACARPGVYVPRPCAGICRASSRGSRTLPEFVKAELEGFAGCGDFEKGFDLGACVMQPTPPPMPTPLPEPQPATDPDPPTPEPTTPEPTTPEPTTPEPMNPEPTTPETAPSVEPPGEVEELPDPPPTTSAPLGQAPAEAGTNSSSLRGGCSAIPGGLPADAAPVVATLCLIALRARRRHD